MELPCISAFLPVTTGFGIYNESFFNQKLQYIHRNPVNGKWKLVNDYMDYEHSSASFYEAGLIKKYEPFDYRLYSGLFTGGPWPTPKGDRI